jgi:hypothetical protein
MGILCLSEDWQGAKRIYRRNRNSTLWRKSIKDKYPNLPVDLIEWLALSKEKRDIGVDAFPNLSDDERRRLDHRMKMDGYWLSMPSEIALEHAARLCGCPPYSHSIYRLKNIKSKYKKEAGRMGSVTI